MSAPPAFVAEVEALPGRKRSIVSFCMGRRFRSISLSWLSTYKAGPNGLAMLEAFSDLQRDLPPNVLR